MTNNKVAQLRQLISDALPEDPVRRTHVLSVHAAYNSLPLRVRQSPRLRAEREILRIAAWYGLADEIVRILDSEQVESLASLSDRAVDELSQRMRQLEDCIREGLDCPDTPPAR